MILVTGGSGQLAQCLKDKIPNAKYLDSSELDITNKDQVFEVLENLRPTILINCAAFTNVDLCESEKDKAYSVNTEGVGFIAEASAKHQFKLIHISTDYVFSGQKNTPYKESDETSPLGVYGRTKLEGEKRIQKLSPDFLIIRTSWLYSENGNNFVKNIIKLMTSRDKLGIVFDQVGSPTYAGDLAQCIYEITKTPEKCKNEVLHYSNHGVCSWFDLTKEVQSIAGVDCEINPIESFEYPTPAKRPNYSVFNTKKLESIFGINIPYWKESLKLCLKKLS